jgi:hypothetical protein
MVGGIEFDARRYGVSPQAGNADDRTTLDVELVEICPGSPAA